MNKLCNFRIVIQFCISVGINFVTMGQANEAGRGEAFNGSIEIEFEKFSF